MCSMISAQCAELRELAAKYDELKSGATRVVRISLDTGSVLREAADTIDRLDAKNDRLRNEVDNLLDFEHLTSVAVAYAGCDECGEYKQTMLRLFAENAKLRELVRWMYDRMDESCAAQHPYAPAPISYDRLMQALARARELGIEVDKWRGRA